jgi:hypothetical protein
LGHHTGHPRSPLTVRCRGYPKGRVEARPALIVGFDPDVVIHCDRELLLAAKVFLGRLDAYM